MTILNCPLCLSQGRKIFLGSFLPNGDFKVTRFQKETVRHHEIEEVEYATIIRSEEFSIICSICQSTVTYRKPKLVTLPPQVNILNSWGTVMTYYATI